MSRTLTVHGLVLKRFDLGEADRILTVYSKELGKISVLAKGVRRTTSRKAGSVEIGNILRLFLAEGKNFYILSEVSLINSFSRLKSNLAVLKYGYHILELIDAMTVEGQEDVRVFNLAHEALSYLNNTPRQLYVRAFEVKLLTELGYLTVSDENYIQNTVLGYHLVDEDTIEVLKILQTADFKHIKGIEITQKEAEQLEQFMTFRIEKVIEREMRSKQFFE